MAQFRGFPERMQFTSIPNIFFSNLMPQIDDMAELKTTLHVIGAIYRKRGYPKFVSCSELLANRSLISSLKGMAAPPPYALQNALEMATKRGVLLHLALDSDGVLESIYFLNDSPGRQAIYRIKSGNLELPGFRGSKATPYVDTEEPPDIFTLYEQNIGMLTPMISEELREAVRLYPENWVRDAIKEAVALNKRNWRYIAAILEHWTAKGRGDETYRRDSAKKTDPDKYIKGKYGHMVQR